MAAARAGSDIWRGSLFSRGFIYNQGLKPCTEATGELLGQQLAAGASAASSSGRD